MKKIVVTLATLAASAGIALAGSGQAQADPGLCWNGWLWSACVQGPGWVDWNPGWDGGCNPGHGCGDWRHGGKHGWK
jgi:hypothetical protein